jgi:hypothetical protein
MAVTAGPGPQPVSDLVEQHRLPKRVHPACRTVASGVARGRMLAVEVVGCQAPVLASPLQKLIRIQL